MLSMNAKNVCPEVLSARRLATFRQHPITALILVFVACCLAVAQTKSPSPLQGQNRFTSALNMALKQGHDAVLPPHISHLLGISPDEHGISVKQLVLMGEVIKGFEISKEWNDDIVIFVEDRSKNQSTFYLTSPKGRVRKVVNVKEGVGYDRLPTAADKKAFEAEKQFWLDRLTPQHS
jgi:hypothetical protein